MDRLELLFRGAGVAAESGVGAEQAEQTELRPDSLLDLLRARPARERLARNPRRRVRERSRSPRSARVRDVGMADEVAGETAGVSDASPGH
eukprot:12789780-Alexandrium_andersonii.AAC.1